MTNPNPPPRVCAWCRRVREAGDDRWAAAELPASPHTHGICPACVEAVLRESVPGPDAT